MFHHVKELEFNARVSAPDPRFASLLLEQFGGANGELKAAMQYFLQAFAARKPFPDKYDLSQEAEELSRKLSIERSQEIEAATKSGSTQWSTYPKTSITSPTKVQDKQL